MRPPAPSGPRSTTRRRTAATAGLAGVFVLLVAVELVVVPLVSLLFDAPVFVAPVTFAALVLAGSFPAAPWAGAAVVLDLTPSATAEGKLRVALQKGATAGRGLRNAGPILKMRPT